MRLIKVALQEIPSPNSILPSYTPHFAIQLSLYTKSSKLTSTQTHFMYCTQHKNRKLAVYKLAIYVSPRNCKPWRSQ